MKYEQLYCALRICLSVFSFLYFGSVFNKTIIGLAFVEYERSDSQLALSASLAVGRPYLTRAREIIIHYSVAYRSDVLSVIWCYSREEKTDVPSG